MGTLSALMTGTLPYDVPRELECQGMADPSSCCDCEPWARRDPKRAQAGFWVSSLPFCPGNLGLASRVSDGGIWGAVFAGPVVPRSIPQAVKCFLKDFRNVWSRMAPSPAIQQCFYSGLQGGG